jgi:Domain of unknown function (DUF1824)
LLLNEATGRPPPILCGQVLVIDKRRTLNFKDQSWSKNMSLSPEESHRVLTDPSSANQEQIREALASLSALADYRIFGICADTTSQAALVLASYLKVLDEELPMPEVESLETTGIYLKFNPRTGRCHADAYTGTERGVIISFHSPEVGEINDTYGGLPLDLYLVSS